MDNENIIKAYRENIDNIDKKIVDLLEERMNNSIEIGKIKFKHNMKILDNTRENQVLENIKSSVKINKYEEYIVDIMNNIIRNSRKLQQDISKNKFI